MLLVYSYWGAIECWLGSRSFMFDSAVNSISSMRARVYQWSAALRRNMPVNCSATRFITSCMQVDSSSRF